MEEHLWHRTFYWVCTALPTLMCAWKSSQHTSVYFVFIDCLLIKNLVANRSFTNFIIGKRKQRKARNHSNQNNNISFRNENVETLIRNYRTETMAYQTNENLNFLDKIKWKGTSHRSPVLRIVFYPASHTHTPSHPFAPHHTTLKLWCRRKSGIDLELALKTHSKRTPTKAIPQSCIF